MDDIDDDVEDDERYSGTEGDTWGRRGNNIQEFSILNEIKNILSFFVLTKSLCTAAFSSFTLLSC